MQETPKAYKKREVFIMKKLRCHTTFGILSYYLNRFITKHNLLKEEYQGICESICWLREKN